MIDPFGRKIRYLRVSVTELCNMRCRYCMPEDGVEKKNHEDMMTQEETIQAIRAAAALGIEKVRITGGEPLIKRNIVEICRAAAETPGIREVCLTTNGILLPQMARELKEAGVKRLNISCDTLDPDKFRYITRIGSFEEMRQGLFTALELGFEKIKINAVLIGGFNLDEVPAFAELTRQYPIDIRFIEMMPMCDSKEFGPEAFVPYTAAMELLPDLEPVGMEGVSRMYRLPGAMGRMGFISPVSAHFCGTCDRLRLTADGRIKPCLHSSLEFPIRGLDYVGMVARFKEAVEQKPQWHGELSFENRSHAGRTMNQIGG